MNVIVYGYKISAPRFYANFYGIVFVNVVQVLLACKKRGRGVLWLHHISGLQDINCVTYKYVDDSELCKLGLNQDKINLRHVIIGSSGIMQILFDILKLLW